MSYKPYYTEGWKSGKAGGTPITPEALNHMEAGIEAAHENLLPAPQTASNKVFLRNDNTWQTVTPANIGAAAASHGNHVPTTQTASNKVFLRNDNTWQTVTPANIGAAASSHNHAASNITSGTLGVARGGTGRATLTANAVLAGNTTSAVNQIATASGALYATAANGAAKFGTLPVAQGGTGATTAANARTNLGLAAFETKVVTNSSALGLFQTVKNQFSSLSNNVVYVIRVSDTTPQRFAIGQKYGTNYGYFIGCTLDGLYYYRNYNGSWSEKAIATW